LQPDDTAGKQTARDSVLAGRGTCRIERKRAVVHGHVAQRKEAAGGEGSIPGNRAVDDVRVTEREKAAGNSSRSLISRNRRADDPCIAIGRGAAAVEIAGAGVALDRARVERKIRDREYAGPATGTPGDGRRRRRRGDGFLSLG